MEIKNYKSLNKYLKGKTKKEYRIYKESPTNLVIIIVKDGKLCIKNVDYWGSIEYSEVKLKEMLDFIESGDNV